jgi:hypothetical protein
VVIHPDTILSRMTHRLSPYLAETPNQFLGQVWINHWSVARRGGVGRCRLDGLSSVAASGRIYVLHHLNHRLSPYLAETPNQFLGQVWINHIVSTERLFCSFTYPVRRWLLVRGPTRRRGEVQVGRTLQCCRQWSHLSL